VRREAAPLSMPHKYSLMHAYLAHITNRSFVFDDYIWSHGPLPFTVDDFQLRAARIPLNAFVSGPMAGAPFFAPPDSFPPAVHAEFWHTICPPEKRRSISSAHVPDHVWGTGRIRWWKDQIRKENVSCLELVTHQKPIFDFRCLLDLMFKSLA